MCLGYDVSMFMERVSPAVAVSFRELPGTETTAASRIHQKEALYPSGNRDLRLGMRDGSGEPSMTASVSPCPRIESVFNVLWWMDDRACPSAT
jgi:hypothetical protein